MVVEVVLLGLLLFILWQVLKKPKNYPPGRWGLPLVGRMPLPGPSIEDYVTTLHQEYGDIYIWRVGTQILVFVHDYRLVRDTFNKPEFTNRPDWDIFLFLEETALGVVSSNDAVWLNNRRFALRQLRDLGMGKSRLVAAVQQQAAWLAEVMVEQSGKAAPVPYALRVAIVNVIWQLVGGKQFDIGDPKMIEFEKLMEDSLNAQSNIAIGDLMPWLKKFMPAFLYDRLIKKDVMINVKESFLKFFYEEIEEHRATMSPGEARDLIDGYLMEMENRKDDPETTFSKRDLAILVLDLFFAGNETTTTTLTWMFYYLATYPGAQAKMQAEIDTVLGDRQATLDDRPRLPYTEAVIHEVLRKSSLTPISLMHSASQDTTLGGYAIPKGAVVCGVTFSIHNDPRYWDRPEEFLPERWLDDEGKFVAKKEGFMPFGVGKRQCLGESLARMELFIISTSILQRVSFSLPKGKKLNLKPDPNKLFLNIPVAQELVISARK